MATLSTHVLDTRLGLPAGGVAVTLETLDGACLGAAATDVDGRVTSIGPERLGAGDYRLRFDSGNYFAASSTAAFYPEIAIAFSITEPDEHHHVPLLLSPFGYSTYRGS